MASDYLWLLARRHQQCVTTFDVIRGNADLPQPLHLLRGLDGLDGQIPTSIAEEASRLLDF